MAFGSLLALFDDIATTLDDVAAMTKAAATKTAGVVGDDLAVGAGQVTGSPAAREIPIVLQVMKGSFINKLLIVPIAMLLSIFAPFAIMWVLVAGGLYLAYEGVEKVLEVLFHKNTSETKLNLTEAEKIKGAVATDLVLSTEIIVIALASVQSKPWIDQALALGAIAIIMTLFIYLTVMLIVKLDDIGFYLNRTAKNKMVLILAKGLISAAPKLMKGLGVVGTAAMLYVAGSIFMHIPVIHHAVDLSGYSAVASFVLEAFANLTLAGVAGVLAVLVHKALHVFKKG